MGQKYNIEFKLKEVKRIEKTGGTVENMSKELKFKSSASQIIKINLDHCMVVVSGGED